ncbi:MAG: hypothetical protein ACRDNS_31460, partial [Trebonia sp.]
MQPGELKPLLEQLRRVRSGTLTPHRAPEPLASYISHGVGHLCDLLGAWLEEGGSDRRAVDAAIRFYGLGRMPEPLESIAQSLRGTRRPRGVTARRARQLIDTAIANAEQRTPTIRIGAVEGRAKPPHDPFPLPMSLPERRRLSRVLLWAWADSLDPPARDRPALMLYEYEHGLRNNVPRLTSRTERQRLRRRAWSMLDVAEYRLGEAIPTDPVVDRTLGPRHLAMVDALPTEGLDALMLLGINPRAGDLRVALASVRAAVHAGCPEAGELLGLLRDATAQLGHVPADVTSKVLALGAIVGRERLNPTGAVAGEQAVRHAFEYMSGRTLGADGHPVAASVISGALRAGQESAEVSYAFGNLPRAWRAIRLTEGVLATFGDPEPDVLPHGWRQQFLLYEASWFRALGAQSARPERWFTRAEQAAVRSASLALDTGALPPTWGLAAEQQRVGVTLDRAGLAGEAGDTASARRLLTSGRRRLNALEAQLLALARTGADAETAQQIRSGLLAAARSGWRVALLDNDRDAAIAARTALLARLGP